MFYLRLTNVPQWKIALPSRSEDTKACCKAISFCFILVVPYHRETEVQYPASGVFRLE